MADVFFNFEPNEVEASANLAVEGFMDSFSVIAVFAIIDERPGGERAQTFARREDFASLAFIKRLYLRLQKASQNVRHIRVCGVVAGRSMHCSAA